MADLTTSIILMTFFGIYLFFCNGLSLIAKNTGRSRKMWFFLALFFTPVTAFIFLNVTGPSDRELQLAEKTNRIEERHPDHPDPRSLIPHESNCPHCQAPINFQSGYGIEPIESSSYKIRCTECKVEIQPAA